MLHSTVQIVLTIVIPLKVPKTCVFISVTVWWRWHPTPTKLFFNLISAPTCDCDTKIDSRSSATPNSRHCEPPFFLTIHTWPKSYWSLNKPCDKHQLSETHVYHHLCTAPSTLLFPFELQISALAVLCLTSTQLPYLHSPRTKRRQKERDYFKPKLQRLLR